MTYQSFYFIIPSQIVIPEKHSKNATKLEIQMMMILQNRIPQHKVLTSQPKLVRIIQLYVQNHFFHSHYITIFEGRFVQTSKRIFTNFRLQLILQDLVKRHSSLTHIPQYFVIYIAQACKYNQNIKLYILFENINQRTIRTIIYLVYVARRSNRKKER